MSADVSWVMVMSWECGGFAGLGSKDCQRPNKLLPVINLRRFPTAALQQSFHFRVVIQVALAIFGSEMPQVFSIHTVFKLIIYEFT